MAAAVAAIRRRESNAGGAAAMDRHEIAKRAGNSAVEAIEAERLLAALVKREQKKQADWEAEITRLSVFPGHRPCVACCTRLRDAPWFSASIIGVIFIAGILVGIQTYPIEPNSKIAFTCALLDVFVLWIFVLEIVVKMIAEGKSPWRYFRDAWNVFDFSIVAVGFMPIGGGGAVTALRLLRLLRVLKLVKALPKLQILVIGLIKSMSSIGYVGALLILVFYLFAVLGMGFFGANDPVHMGELWISMLSLFRAATLEDWTDLMYIGMYGCENYGYSGMEHLCTHSHASGLLAAIYWVVLVLLASMMILNLFIGVIASSMQDAQNELAEEKADEALLGVDESTEARLTEISEIMTKAANELDTFSREEMKQVDDRKARYVEDALNARPSGSSSGMGSILAVLRQQKEDAEKAKTSSRFSRMSMLSRGSNEEQK
jgi:voltage-gated sodium channel